MAAKSVNNLTPEQIANAPLKLVYTPLNGTGLIPVTTVLNKVGVTDITVVPEQRDPDGDFPTCPYPNPEIREAMTEGQSICARRSSPTCYSRPTPTPIVWAWPAPMVTTTRC